MWLKSGVEFFAPSKAGCSRSQLGHLCFGIPHQLGCHRDMVATTGLRWTYCWPNGPSEDWASALNICPKYSKSFWTFHPGSVLKPQLVWILCQCQGRIWVSLILEERGRDPRHCSACSGALGLCLSGFLFRNTDICLYMLPFRHTCL